MQAFGWTWEYVDELDLPRVQSIYAGLRQRPPIHWIGAAFVKFEPVKTGGGESGGSAAGQPPSAMFDAMAGRLLDG